MGLRGNYQVFPVLPHNHLTASMALDDLDDNGVFADPDGAVELTEGMAKDMLFDLDEREEKMWVSRDLAAQLMQHLTEQIVLAGRPGRS
jgi:hypothetical protein